MKSQSTLRGTRRVAAAPEMPIVFFNAYVEAALWSSYGDDGEPLDATYTVDDIADESLAAMEQDCQAFWRANHEDLGQYRDPKYGAEELGGHDFWLTRNGHGAGFWDRDLPDDVGKRLTEAAKVFGEDDLYLGDDGRIYNTAVPHEHNEALDQPLGWTRGAGVRTHWPDPPREFYVTARHLCAFHGVEPDQVGLWDDFDVRVYLNHDGGWSVEPLNQHAEIVDSEWAPKNEQEAAKLYADYGQE